ncbi:MAG: arginine--tRNA ligase [Planctomycetes bacterium]|nr:arginine--tRNA ligase [Planctomycetota bacterium]
MTPTIDLLKQRVAAAVAQACDLVPADIDPMVRRVQDEKFGDYQSNCAMGLAKRLGVKPREIAQRIVDQLNVEPICEAPEIAGPGFINLRLAPAFVASQLSAVPPVISGQADRMGLTPDGNPTVVAVDLSSPNLAKEMHVGHLRSTVIGDCIARVLEFRGHTVHRINHVGDWGTQFGMLLAHLVGHKPDVLEHAGDLALGDLEQFYIEAKALYDVDAEFAAEARRNVVRLQSQEPAMLAVWRAFCDESRRHCQAIFHRLDVQLEDRGESFYREMLGPLVAELEQKGIAAESEGALCIFLDGFKSREGTPLPMIIRKSDGGYNYDTTDLAAIRHRIETLGAKRLIYVVGVAQKQHFQMLFAAARRIGWVGDNVSLIHVGFGNLLGSDGTPFKTSTGGNVKLKDLLDEAVARAHTVIEHHAADQGKGRTFDRKTADDIAAAVGIGAIKYFDLSHSLGSDYKFHWDTMLAMEGNTAPYMLYAYARIRSIGRKAGIDYADIPSDTPIVLEHQSERRLGKTLLRFGEIVEQVAEELRPNVLTDYLYELSKAFSQFYDRRIGVRVIDAEPDSLRLSRLRLCDLTARTLKLGLGLLGIKTVEQM